MWFGQPKGLRNFGIALGFLMAGASASAAPGDHLRAGDAVITPSLGVGFEYRTNAFRSDSQAQGTGALRIAPGLAVTAESPQVLFAFDGKYALRKYLFLANPNNVGQAEISRQISNLDRFNAFNVSADLQALRDRQISLRLNDTAVLRNNPNDSVPDSDDPYATQFRNSLTGGIVGRPGPALSFDLGGTWRYSTFFVPSGVEQRDPLNSRNSFGPTLNIKYAFLPRTAYVVEARFTVNQWATPTATLGDQSFPTPNSQHLQALTGVQGRISERLRLVLKGGYGTAWYADGNNLSAVNGLLLAMQADYDATKQHQITLGYRKSFIDSFFTNVAAHNSLYARWSGQYGERLSSNLTYGLRFENYDGEVVQRNDIVNQLRFALNYKANDWVTPSLSGGWLGRSSSDAIVEYNDVRVLLGATFQY